MGALTVAVIGGGIQGVCSALALARHGARVTVIEAADALLDRASFRGEGKIHLGFVYAHDPTGLTGGLMLESALRFAPLIEKWIGPVEWTPLRSRAFTYATLPDSQLSAARLREHYEKIDQMYRENYRGSDLHYLGLTPDTLLPRRDEGSTSQLADAWLAKGSVVATTAEVAVDRPAFRRQMRAAVAATLSIGVRLGCRVEDVVRRTGGFQVFASGLNEEPWHGEFDVVVNCSWTDRLRLDRQQGLEPDRGWVYRLKYRLLGRLPGAFDRPSLTFALGPYGDLVTFPGDHVYISWYPVCMRGWSRDLTPPDGWSLSCIGRTPQAEAEEVKAGVMKEFGAIIPDLRKVAVDDVGAGVIFSWGTRDIDQPDSELHRRSEVGVDGGDGYYTINTGKFTCAPLFAERLTVRMRADGHLG